MQRRNWERFAGHSGSGGHGHEHDHTSDHSHDQGEVDGVDLFPQIDMDKVRCLNDRRSSGKCCLKPYAKRLDHRTYLLSEEDDPEVILHVPFTEGVRLAGICICADDNTNAPRNVKIFVNREDVDFGLAEDLKADLYLKDMHKDVSADVFYFPRFKGIATNLKRQVVHAVYELRSVEDVTKTFASSGAPAKLGQ
eukprot:g4915.t1